MYKIWITNSGEKSQLLLFIPLSVQFSHSVVSDSLWPHWLQCARLPCPSPTPKTCSNSCPSSRVPSNNHLLLLPSIFRSIRVFPNESVLHIRWPKYWSFIFSSSPSNKYPGLISFKMDWLDLLAVHRLSRVFSSTAVQRHQFFGTQLSLKSNYHIHMWLLEKK